FPGPPTVTRGPRFPTVVMRAAHTAETLVIPDFRQRTPTAAPAQPYRAVDAIEGLFQRGTISKEGAVAADEFRRAFRDRVARSVKGRRHVARFSGAQGGPPGFPAPGTSSDSVSIATSPAAIRNRRLF